MRSSTLALSMIGLAGAVILAIGAYSQYVSMDLGSHELGEYLRRDMKSVAWWQAVGCLLLGGVVLLLFALYSALRAETLSALSSMISILLVLSIGMSFLSPAWIAVTVIVALALVTHLFGRSQH